MLTGLWPAHPQPLPDELLSSWMIRLAHANGYKVQSFYAHFFGKERSIWTRDIDHQGPAWLIEGLSAGAGLPVDRVQALTLRGFESFAFEQYNDRGVTRGLLPLGVRHRTRTAYGQQFCPSCLDEDPVPYMRRRWRLAVCVVCERHQVLLDDRCSNCGRPLAPHRADISSSRWWRLRHPLWRCTYCKEKLTNSPVRASERDVVLQRHLTGAVDAGFALVGGIPVYSHLYFDGLRVLITALRRSASVSGHANFERTTGSDRLAWLHAALELTSDWPLRLLAWARSVRKPYTVLTRDVRKVPWWLDSVLRMELIQRRSRLLADEAHAILAASVRTGAGGTVAAARKLSGRDVGTVVHRRAVDDRMARSFLSSLADELHASTGIRRSLLERDLAMFVVGRALALTQAQICRLTLQDLTIALRPARATPGLPRLDLGAGRLVEAYVAGARNAFVGERGGSLLFPGIAGAILTPNAVGMRFSRAVRAAKLDCAEMSWGSWVRGG
jgi:hypothetical protein